MHDTVTNDQLHLLARMAAGVERPRLTDDDIVALRTALMELGRLRHAEPRKEYIRGLRDAAEVCFTAAQLARSVRECDCSDVAHLYDVRGEEILEMIPEDAKDAARSGKIWVTCDEEATVFILIGSKHVSVCERHRLRGLAECSEPVAGSLQGHLTQTCMHRWLADAPKEA